MKNSLFSSGVRFVSRGHEAQSRKTDKLPTRGTKRKRKADPENLTHAEAKVASSNLTTCRALKVWDKVTPQAALQKTIDAILDQASLRKSFDLESLDDRDYVNLFAKELPLFAKALMLGKATQDPKEFRSLLRTLNASQLQDKIANTHDYIVRFCEQFPDELEGIKEIVDYKRRYSKAALSFPAIWNQFRNRVKWAPDNSGAKANNHIVLPSRALLSYSGDFGTKKLRASGYDFIRYFGEYSTETTIVTMNKRQAVDFHVSTKDLLRFITEMQEALSDLPCDIYYLVMHYATNIHHGLKCV